MKQPSDQPPATLHEPSHLEDHQAGPNIAAEGLHLVRLVRELASRHVYPVSVVKKSLSSSQPCKSPSVKEDPTSVPFPPYLEWVKPEGGRALLQTVLHYTSFMCLEATFLTSPSTESTALSGLLLLRVPTVQEGGRRLLSRGFQKGTLVTFVVTDKILLQH